MKRLILIFLAACVVIGLVGGYFLLGGMIKTRPRSARLGEFFTDPQGHASWVVPAGSRCGDAPLIFPTDGYIGFLWGDSWRPGHQHQGLDIFSPALTPGQTPVIAAYDGYLTRLPEWKSTVIIRVPQDPLQPDRQVWMYYTHMADAQGNELIAPEYPAGTTEVFVKAGTRLGYQGNFSGTPDNPTGTHLHFSIVLDNGEGKFRNELDINNTVDPSPYFNMRLNAANSDGAVTLCPE